MRTFEVVITKTITRTVPVEAESIENAEELVKAMCDRHEIELTAEDHSETEIQAAHEGICPLCGAEIEYDGFHEMDDCGGMYTWDCPQCGAHGKEGYTRKFDGYYSME